MTPKLQTILVSACGGDIGHNIGRIIINEDIAQQVIGLDVREHHAGPSLFNKCIVVPMASSDKYLATIEGLVEKHNPEIFIPVSEPEIDFFNKNNIRKIKSTLILMPSKEIIDLGLDKYSTYTFLKDSNLPFPWTILGDKERPLAFPCIAKARRGCGSKTISIIEDNHDLARQQHRDRGKDFVFQELLLPANEEYTCGLYKNQRGVIRTIIIKRKLQGGITSEGKIVSHLNMEKLLVNIANNSNLVGSVNVQLRLTDRGPIVFEINPRFSSTVYFRYLLGFKDLVWSIQDLLGYSPSDYDKPENGIRFYRVSQEVIIPNQVVTNDKEL